MKYLILSLLLSSSAFSKEVMFIERACTVKALGRMGPQYRLAIGDAVKIKTTTFSNDYVNAAQGVNSIVMPKFRLYGTRGLYSYTTTRDVFTLLGGTEIMILKEGEGSTFTGKYLGTLANAKNQKIADMTCKNVRKIFGEEIRDDF